MVFGSVTQQEDLGRSIVRQKIFSFLRTALYNSHRNCHPSTRGPLSSHNSSSLSSSSSFHRSHNSRHCTHHLSYLAGSLSLTHKHYHLTMRCELQKWSVCHNPTWLNLWSTKTLEHRDMRYDWLQCVDRGLGITQWRVRVDKCHPVM